MFSFAAALAQNPSAVSPAGATKGEAISLPTHGAQLPLALVSIGDHVHVAKVHGSPELKAHLASLGFVEGAEVSMVNCVCGNVVVNVKGSTFALDKSMAMKVVTY